MGLRHDFVNDQAVRAALLALTADSVLGCWCVNKPNAGERPWQCHGDVIAAVFYDLVVSTSEDL
jgi:hypothetical protein